MKLLCDLHTHTMMSGHAYSSLKENIEAAYEAGLQAYGFSEHAQGFPGAMQNIYFQNFGVVPRRYKDMRVFAGCEANIMSYDGSLDISQGIAKRLDYVIASLHTLCIAPCSMEETMSAYFGAMENPYVSIIGHPDDARFPTDYPELVRKAIATSTVLELNNSSLTKGTARKGGVDNAREMLKECKKQGAYVIVNSDAHIHCSVGKFPEALELLEELRFPEDLLINTDLSRLSMVIHKDLDSEEFARQF